MPKKLPELVSFAEAEEETNVSRWTWRDWAARGLISVIRPPGTRRVYLDRADVIRTLESWKETAGD